MTAPRFLTLSDVAEELQVSLSQVRALVRSGELPAIQIGGRNQWRIERSRFEEYITERHEQTLEAIASASSLQRLRLSSIRHAPRGRNARVVSERSAPLA